MTRTTGAEWKKFYSDTTFWPEDSWHDDAVITVNGVDLYDLPDNFDLTAVYDTDRMTISDGTVYLHEHDLDGPSLEAHFKAWRNKQAHTVFSVECRKERFDDVKAAIIALGGKVLA